MNAATANPAIEFPRSAPSGLRFADMAPGLRRSGYLPLPVNPGTKQPSVWHWTNLSEPCTAYSHPFGIVWHDETLMPGPRPYADWLIDDALASDRNPGRKSMFSAEDVKAKRKKKKRKMPDGIASASTGILLGAEQPGIGCVAALDADIDDPGLSLDYYRACISAVPSLRHAVFRVGGAPHWALLFRTRHDAGPLVKSKAGCVDLLASGCQIVVAGRHASGVPYSTDSAACLPPAACLPLLSPADIDAVMDLAAAMTSGANRAYAASNKSNGAKSRSAGPKKPRDSTPGPAAFVTDPRARFKLFLEAAIGVFGEDAVDEPLSDCAKYRWSPWQLALRFAMVPLSVWDDRNERIRFGAALHGISSDPAASANLLDLFRAFTTLHDSELRDHGRHWRFYAEYLGVPASMSCVIDAGRSNAAGSSPFAAPSGRFRHSNPQGSASDGFAVSYREHRVSLDKPAPRGLAVKPSSVTFRQWLRTGFVTRRIVRGCRLEAWGPAIEPGAAAMTSEELADAYNAEAGIIGTPDAVSAKSAGKVLADLNLHGAAIGTASGRVRKWQIEIRDPGDPRIIELEDRADAGNKSKNDAIAAFLDRMRREMTCKTGSKNAIADTDSENISTGPVAGPPEGTEHGRHCEPDRIPDPEFLRHRRQARSPPGHQGRPATRPPVPD